MWYFKNDRTFLSQIFFILHRMPVGTSIGTTSNNIKSLPHTGDLHTKALQGHYLKHVIIQELQNISLTNIFYFASYAYKNFKKNNIKSLPHIGDLQTKTFQRHYLKHVILQELQNISLTNIFYFASYAYRNFNKNNFKSLPRTNIFYLVTSKPRLFKVTTSNT